MSDDIVAGGIDETPEDWVVRSLVPMKVGEANIYIEASSQPLSVEAGGAGDIYTVSPPSREDAFRHAAEAI